MRRLHARVIAACLLGGLAVCVSGASAQDAEDGGKTIVIRGGTVLPISRPPLAGGVVVIRNGRIVAVGGEEEAEAYPDAEVVDATDRIVMPGLVDGYTHLGLVEIGAVDVTRDLDEAVAPLTPQVHTADGIHVESSLLRVTRMHGTTTALVAPAEGNLVSGRSCLIRLRGDRLAGMLLRPSAALHASLGEPPMRRFGEQKQAPSTRMGELAMLRAALTEAREYVAAWKRYEDDRTRALEEGEEEPDPPVVDLEKEAWRSVLAKERPFIVRAQRVSDIEAALRLAEEFDLRLVLLRATEAWKMADRLAAAGVDVLYGPVVQQPSSMETQGARMDAPAILHRAGVRFALVSAGAHNARNLPIHAGIAISYGLPFREALAAITLRPAEILGVDGEVGSLEPGRSADVILLDGPVYQPRTRVLRMWIAGREVELTSRQTELAEQYR